MVRLHKDKVLPADSKGADGLFCVVVIRRHVSIREKYPVKIEKVEGELYHRYWIDEEYLAELKEVGKQVSGGTFFSNLVAV